MERNQTETHGTPDRAGPRGSDATPKEPRSGEGAASALAFLKRIERERERANATRADDRPAS